MKEGESFENMFAYLSKITGELKAARKKYPPIEHIRRIIRSLPQQWHAKVVALVSMDLKSLTYDEVRGDLIIFRKTRLKKKGKEDDKEKSVAFKALDENQEEDEEFNKDEIALLTKFMMETFRHNKIQRRVKQNYSINNQIINYNRNASRCYDCNMFGHITSRCPEAKRRYSQGQTKNKTFSGWGADDISKFCQDEFGNICFMVIRESSQVKSDFYKKKYLELRALIDQAIIDLKRILAPSKMKNTLEIQRKFMLSKEIS